MKFLIISRFKNEFFNLPAETRSQLLSNAKAANEKFIKEGKYREMYFLGHMSGTVLIADLDSSEDVARIAIEHPLYGYLDVEITPLVDMEVGRKVQAR